MPLVAGGAAAAAAAEPPPVCDRAPRGSPAADALRALSQKRSRKAARNPLTEENQKLKAQGACLEKKLQQDEIIIDV